MHDCKIASTNVLNAIIFSGEKAVILEKYRQSRLHLRRHLNAAKSSNPDAKCSLDNEKLVVEGKVFVYSEAAGRVVNKSVEKTEDSEEISANESQHDR